MNGAPGVMTTPKINRIWFMINRICKSGFRAKSGSNPVVEYAAQSTCLEINRIYRICSEGFTRVRGHVRAGVCACAPAYTWRITASNPVNPVDLQPVALSCENVHRIYAGFGPVEIVLNPDHIRWSPR